ncbi:sporulation protein YqfD [Oceanobacillus saliphilus]|uniref:sporulation protein YqfD n=1 Tax=Oceanobacillus saliphilus TaxID=2925834 RepID=UPI00201DD047|nr:sporulation protein YqfD [Oceanobacillus saliphilus]
MKKFRNGSDNIAGYVTILVKGTAPELFFQKCASEGIRVWDVKKNDKESCEGNIRLSDIKKMKTIRRKTIYKVSFIGRNGYPFLISRFFRKKPLVIGLIFSFLLFLLLSNIIWEVKITGVPKDIEEKIDKQLTSYGVHPGAWLFSLKTPTEIQQKLIEDIPELLWAGVDQKGTTFYLEGVEKIIVQEADPKQPRNLVASKKGVITKMYVSKGTPMVKVNDYVEPGDILVSGSLQNIEESNSEEKDEEEKQVVEHIAAEAEITANTWYEVSLTVPLEYNYEQLTGNVEKKFYLKTGNFQLPIWGFKEPPYEDIHREITENKLNFLKWELPVSIIETVLSEKQYIAEERTKEEAIEAGIEQAVIKLKQELGPDAKILSEKVLHETIERGKVKLSLYVSVEENIVKLAPINQGD